MLGSILILVVLSIAAAAIAGMVSLWLDPRDVPHDDNPYSAEGVTTSKQVGQEIVRTLVGAIGLVLAVPITTGLAVFMAPTPEEEAFDSTNFSGSHAGRLGPA